jgi:DNA-binding MarR family transcriptional regulator
MRDLSLSGYRALAEFRYQIRRFLHFSEEQVRSLGLEPQQHQLLLTIKGLPPGTRATIGELAVRLQLKHHSAVELVDRLVRRGYVLRSAGQDDRRQVIVRLTVQHEETSSCAGDRRFHGGVVAPLLMMGGALGGIELSREYAVDPLEILFVRDAMRTNLVAFSVRQHVRTNQNDYGSQPWATRSISLSCGG